MSERSRKIEAIFHAAAELNSAAERGAYLDEACANDPELRREVEALLGSSDAAGPFFQAARDACRMPETVPAFAPVETPGDRIGRYKLLQKIGEGGMGVVYMAEQDEPVRRRVALKIIKLGMDTCQVVARFEAERQALAMMDHPNIARVLDGGATETGRPYFVMELVQGVPVTEYCDANQLSVADRLRLFIAVCHAIQSAHQKGIIHRDIKPSNVLVTQHNGVAHPMVIDFGVARAIDQKLTEKTLFTHFATMIGTPAYMSPEQAEMSKLDVDTRSDIYALGVLLYELLTGSAPFPDERLRRVAWGEMQRIIAEEEPERPSTRLKKSAIAGSASPLVTHHSPLATDLDWIVMKCLEKDRNRRYDTASALEADITRHLNHEPVVARPPSRIYEFRKLVRRHKVGFAATAAVILALAAGLVVSWWQALRAMRAEQSAKEQAEVAQAVQAFLTENLLGGGMNPFSPESEPVATGFTRALAERAAEKLTGKFADQPMVEIEIRKTLDWAIAGLGDYRNRLVQSERLLELQTRLLGPYHSDTLLRISFVAGARSETGRRQEALKLVEDTLAAIQDSPARTSAGGGNLLKEYARLLRSSGRPDDALPFAKEAVTILKQTLGPAHPGRNAVFEAMEGLARATESAGQLEEADALSSQALRECEQANGPEHPLTLEHRKSLACLWVRQKRGSEALPVLSQVIALQQQKFGAGYPSMLDAQYWLGQAYEQTGEIEAAAKLYTEIHPRLAAQPPSDNVYFCLSGIVKFFLRHERYDDALAVYRAWLESYRTGSPGGRLDIEWLTAATAAVDGWQAAARVCRDEAGHMEGDASTLREVATIFLYAGDADGYRQTVTRAFKLAPTLKPGGTPWGEQHHFLNVLIPGTNEFSPARVTLCEASIKSVEQSLATATTDQQNSIHRTLGGMLLRLGRLSDSLKHLELAAKRYRPGLDLARALVLKAICLHGMGCTDDARAALDESETMMQSSLLDRLSEREGLLARDERTYLILRREARALFGVK